MIAAGIAALHQWKGVKEELVVAVIYRAMVKVALVTATGRATADSTMLSVLELLSRSKKNGIE
jgi:hypothetical protein